MEPKSQQDQLDSAHRTWDGFILGSKITVGVSALVLIILAAVFFG